MWFRQQSITIQKCLCLKDHYSSKKIIERISRPCKHTNIVFFFECFCNQKRPFMYNLYVFSPQKSRFQSCCLHNHSNFQIQTPSAIRNLLHLAELWGRIHPHCSLSSGFLLKDSAFLSLKPGSRVTHKAQSITLKTSTHWKVRSLTVSTVFWMSSLERVHSWNFVESFRRNPLEREQWGWILPYSSARWRRLRIALGVWIWKFEWLWRQ